MNIKKPRLVTSYEVACPKCGVPADSWCLGRSGQFIASHKQRVQAARVAFGLPTNGAES